MITPKSMLREPYSFDLKEISGISEDSRVVKRVKKGK